MLVGPLVDVRMTVGDRVAQEVGTHVECMTQLVIVLRDRHRATAVGGLLVQVQAFEERGWPLTVSVEPSVAMVRMPYVEDSWSIRCPSDGPGRSATGPLP